MSAPGMDGQTSAAQNLDTNPQPAAEGEWHRVHPLTPYVRSWLLIVALVWGVGNVFLDDVLAAIVYGDPLDVDFAGTVQLVGLGLVAAVLCGVVGLVIGLGVLSWWFTRYQITPDHVRFRNGAIFRTQRQARLDRVQGIDIERKFLPRIFGLASLKFDVADGGSSALELSYLRRDKARELRHQLLGAVREASRSGATAQDDARGDARDVHGHDDAAGSPSAATAPVAAGHRPAPWDHSPQAQEQRALLARYGVRSGLTADEERSREIRAAQRLGLLTDQDDQDQQRRVFTVPTSRVLLSLLLSWSTISAVFFAIVAVVVWRWNPEALRVLIPSYLPVVIMIVSGLYNRLESSWGFTLSQVHVGVRVRSGLLNERSSTIPVGRVQALQVSKPMLWRVFDGHRVKVSTAGKGGIDDMEGLRSLVLPVGSPENVAEILELVLPLAEPPTELVRDGLNGIDGDQEYTISPRRARWVDPLTWRRTGFAMDDAVLAMRWGRLNRNVSVIPHHKTQSLGLQQGPIDRRMRLASIHAHMIAGPVTTTIYHLDVQQSKELLARQTDLARVARDRANHHELHRSREEIQ